MAINILSEDIFNRISAGEVVERPASVIKELFENSIDAGANKITLEIVEGGLKEIVVTDNGCGISFSDIEKAFMPHATSKIKNIEDLDNISSLGFRGEALASIASVSQIEMISKTENEDYGTKICLNAGKIFEKCEVGANVGTTIMVKNLFFNTPARLKFMKKPKLEESEVTHLVSKLILANPTISIRYIVDGKIIYNTFGNGLAEALYIVYGKEAYDNLVEVNSEHENISIHGYIARPTFSKPNKTYATLFVNNRLVNNYMIMSAIMNALEGQIMKGKFPLFALNLTLPYDDVDVNVHPSKQEVKFANPGKIYGFVSDAIFKALSGVDYTQNIEIKSEIKPVESVEPQNLQNLSKNEGASFNFLFNSSLAEDKFQNMPSKLVEIVLNDDAKQENVQMEIQPQIAQTEIKTNLRDYKIIGTIFNTYIVLEQNDKVLIMDQHAGHERCLYDNIMKELSKGKIASQSLFFPQQIKINNKEYEFLVENKANLNNFGFTIVLDKDLLNVVAVPYILNSLNVKSFFESVLAEPELFMGKPISYINEKFTQLACKSAIKAGDKISEDEIEILINNFANGDHVLLCPHGRPIVVEISKYEIEKLFRRKV